MRNTFVSACFALLLMNVPADTAAAYGLASYALITGAILLVSAR